MPHKPSISVIIPTYNSAGFLPDALDSIRSQAVVPQEILVVDDGSTDDTAELLRQFPDITYLHQPNQGPSAARNAGIERAQGDLLAFLDADDLWTPEHLVLLIEPLERRPDLQFAWGPSLVTQVGEVSPSHLSSSLGQVVPQFLVGAGVYRRQVFQTVGRFDVSMRLAEDLDWFSRARQLRVPHAAIEQPVLIYRKHPGSLTAGKSFHELNVMHMLRRSIGRHRAAADSSSSSIAGKAA